MCINDKHSIKNRDFYREFYQLFVNDFTLSVYVSLKHVIRKININVPSYNNE